MFYLNSTLNFLILPALVFQLEVYYKVDRLLTDLTVNKKEQLLNGIQIKQLYNKIPLLKKIVAQNNKRSRSNEEFMN